MEIKEQIKTKQVYDYDFSFVGNGRLPITVDIESGDKVAELSDRYVIEIQPRPDIINPEVHTNPETFTIFKSNITAYMIRTRQQHIPTEEELFNMREALTKFASTVQ